MTIGHRVPMLDAEQRVTGDTDYVLNLRVPGMLWGKLLRSPHPHARVVRVDTSRASRLPGVVAVVSGQDVLSSGLFPYYGPLVKDTPLIALDRVRYAGEPVAAVAAVDEDVAAEALDLIDVEYEPLPAVYDPVEAFDPGAPLVHERGNVVEHFKARRGEFERAIQDAEVVLSEEYRVPQIQHVPLEPHVVLAEATPRHITIHSSTQTPHVTRAQVADIFGLPIASVRILVRTLGGGYGAKCYPRLEPLATLLSLKAGRPVKIALTRAEEFLTTQRQAATFRLTLGARPDGTLLALKAECFYGCGAYAETAPRVIRHGAYSANGPYRIPNVWVDCYAIYTNTVPCGPFRGPGSGQAHWASESHLDSLAARLGMDPVELRLKNVVHDGDSFVLGGLLEDIRFPEMLEQITCRLDADGAGRARSGRGVRVGRGYALALKTTNTPSTSTAFAIINEDGSLSVITSSVEMGQGAQTVLAQIAADAAGLPMSRVSVSLPDTDTTPYDQQTSSSRTTFAMGTAVKLAVKDAQAQLGEHAAHMLEVSPQDLLFHDGRVEVRGAPERSLDSGEVVRRARLGNVVGKATFTSEAKADPITGRTGTSAHYHSAAVGVDVAVDVDTGRVELLNCHSAVFAGRAINPTHCELQAEGSVFFGVGHALFEEVTYDDGRVTNPNLSDYMIPSFEDIPSAMGVLVMEDPDHAEIHGVGETALPATAPAIANAIFAATGARVRDLPMTPEKVLRALGEQSRQSPVERARAFQRQAFGERVLTTPSSELIDEGRGERAEELL